ncbi:NUDIX domain-containing protein [uncultured Cocleimonas sp.]|uniref:NUDIX hydrolase n=1 Tax=uncultured Cocleimonas sp. TaxID=1051587 RepID=UPI002602FC0B|nr:NUDIX domain-containing protein [uncultured Cocleimonas sp.]
MTQENFKSPLLTVDSVLFTIKDNSLKILLLKRKNSPFQNSWALPGGFIDVDKDGSAEDTACRKLTDKTGVTPPYLEQLNTFSSKSRDPRGWSASIAYFALIAHEETNLDVTPRNDESAQWVDVESLMDETANYQPLAFDHQQIFQFALERLKQKALYSMLPVFCLPKEFTLGEYHTLIEIILGKSIQKKTLYRRFEASNMFEETGETLATGARAAMLYRLKEDAELVNFERNLG